jgi:hypothetical protein
MFRTEFDKVLALMTGEGVVPEMTLNDEEVNTVRNWIQEDNQHP